MDDFTEHRGFFQKYGGAWAYQDYVRYFETYLPWYEEFFEPAAPHQTIGEDSTVYLASEKAAGRIAEFLPDVHLIFLLRNPVARAYSHYWHSLQAGRAVYRFEDALRYGNDKLITRGFYRKQIARYLNAFPRECITVLIFEDFIQNMQERIDELCATLSVPANLDLATLNVGKKNTSRMPRWPGLMAWQNRLFRSRNARGGRKHLPGPAPKETTLLGKVADSLNFRLRYFNLREGTYPPMEPDTKAFLQKLYARQNRGLSDLIGIDVSKYWPYMGT